MMHLRIILTNLTLNMSTMRLYNHDINNCKSDECRLKNIRRNLTPGEDVRKVLDALLNDYVERGGMRDYWVSQTIYILSLWKFFDQQAIAIEYLRSKHPEQSLQELAYFYYFMQQAELIDGFEAHPKGMMQAYIDVVGYEKAESFGRKYTTAKTKVLLENIPARMKVRVKELLLAYPDAYRLVK